MYFYYYLFFLSLTYGANIISLYGDVFRDTKFFSETFPYIIDNIGGEISVEYYLQGSGRYTVPHMCALNEMKMNTYLQAQYLKCEADGNSSEDCLCASGIDPQKYRHCVLTKGSYASLSAAKYTHLNIDASPIIEVGYKNTVFEVTDNWYLKKICTIFGDNPPRGCVKPFACNTTKDFNERKGLAVFNCPLSHKFNVKLEDNDISLATTITPTPVMYTSAYPLDLDEFSNK